MRLWMDLGGLRSNLYRMSDLKLESLMLRC